jgi:hypothetical protein
MDEKIYELLLEIQRDIKVTNRKIDTIEQRVEKIELIMKNEFEVVNKKLDRNIDEHLAMFELLESDVYRVEQENYNNWKAIAQIQSKLNKRQNIKE